MSDIQTWNGSSTFGVGQTPFGFYDYDSAFQADADKVAKFCATRLGYPLMDVELTSGSLYACFEEAVTYYGNEVYQYKIRESYINMEGNPSNAGTYNNAIIDANLDRFIQIAKNYGTEAEVGGNVTKKTGHLPITPGVQEYDLDQWALDQGIDGGIEIRKIFYEAPPAILRYFDPYAGTGTGIQSLMDAFDFGSYSPGINFLLMPASFDMLKVQAIEFNDQVRRSAYSFEIVNNKLKIFPVPNQDLDYIFEYYELADKKSAGVINATNAVSNIANVPYQNITYSELNSVGKQWIFQYTLALARELLGYIRGKYTQVPIPGSETTLNQADLLADARSEKDKLLLQLRETLDQTSRRSQLERQAAEGDSMNKILSGIPYTIYIG